MADLRLRARPVAEIVDAAFQLYRRDAAEYLLITALAYAPALVAQLLVLGVTGTTEPRSLAGPGAAALLLVGFSFFAFVLMFAVLTRYSADVYLGRTAELSAVARAAIGRIPAMIGAAIGIAVVMAIGFIPVIIGAATGNPGLSAIGAILAIGWIPYAFARYFAVLQIVVLEDADIVTAFRRSARLSHGHKLHIILTILLVVVIVGVLSFAFMFAAMLTASAVVLTVVQTCYMIVAYPLVGISQMVLYYDTRIRAEGFDIEMMASALGPGQTPEGAAVP